MSRSDAFSGRLILAALLCCLVALPAAATVHVVAAPGAPVGAGDGSRSHPWPSLAVALASGRLTGGDQVRLMPGDYGDVVIDGAAFDHPVAIVPDSPATVRLTGLSVTRSRNLDIGGMQVWPDAPSRGVLVRTDARSAFITFRDLDVRARRDAAGYPSWRRDDWLSWQRTGVQVNGPDSAVLDSRLTGLRFGIAATGPRARIAGNTVQGFSGDGIRVLGDSSRVADNRIEDCVQVDANHADGLQSWSRGPDGKAGRGTVRGLVVERNIIREWATPAVSPLRCALQGIGLFDGMYDDVVIRNNLVLASAPHGIAVAGARRLQVVHNTVVNSRAAHPKFPWISITAHKNGTPSRDVLVAGNIATRVNVSRRPEDRVTATGNLLGIAPARLFVDAARGDFRPRPGGPAQGRAAPAHAPPDDLYGTRRDATPDIGAVEYR